MARLVALSTLRQRTRWRTDTENETSRFPDSEVNDCVNEGLAQFHQELLRVRGQGFNEVVASFPTVIAQQYYTMPAATMQLLKVWTTINGFEKVLRVYEEIETEGLSDPVSWETILDPSYRIFNDQISFRPIPNTVNTIFIKYIPAAVKLVNDGDTVDGVDGLEEFVVAWGGVRIAIKNRDWELKGTLDAEMQAIIGRIRTTQRARNAAEPPRMQDVRGGSHYWRRGTRRWGLP